MTPGGSAPAFSRGQPAGFWGRRRYPLERADNPPIGFWGAGRIISAQKPAADNCIYRPVMHRLIIVYIQFFRIQRGWRTCHGSDVLLNKTR